MKKQLNKIAKDTNIFLKKYINSQKYSHLMSPMKYGLFPGGKKIRSKILIDLGSLFSIDYKTLIIIGSAMKKFVDQKGFGLTTYESETAKKEAKKHLEKSKNKESLIAIMGLLTLFSIIVSQIAFRWLL